MTMPLQVVQRALVRRLAFLEAEIKRREDRGQSASWSIEEANALRIVLDRLDLRPRQLERQVRIVTEKVLPQIQRRHAARRVTELQHQAHAASFRERVEVLVTASHRAARVA